MPMACCCTFAWPLGEKVSESEIRNVVLLRHVLDVVLDDDATADYLDIDKHPLAVLGARGTRRDVGR